MLEGGGRMVIAAHERVTGPGHFGRIVEEEGVEKMSCHFEADFDQGGYSVLGIRPLLWKNGWPEAGDPFHEGTYSIISERRGYALELAVDITRIEQARRWFRRDPNQEITPIDMQKLDDVKDSWAKGDIAVRCGDNMVRPHQRWTITAVPDVGGYLGQPYYKIEIEGTHRALAATADCEVTSVENFTAAPEQLWRIDQLIDGTFRIMPKKVPGTDRKLALVSIADSTPTLAEFDFNSDNSKWRLK